MEFETKIISRQIGDMLYASDLSLGTAESCTGGLISEAIIATPGASNYFKGSVVSYTNEIKERLLKVDHQLLEEKTAVCEEVARQMAQGAMDLLNVDFAIASTGVAGSARRNSRPHPSGTIYGSATAIVNDVTRGRSSPTTSDAISTSPLPPTQRLAPHAPISWRKNMPQEPTRRGIESRWFKANQILIILKCQRSFGTR